MRWVSCRWAMVALVCLALAACDSAEDRAERHFQSAETLAAAGDVDRALVELRNVFRLQGSHREARRLYAELQHARGELSDAFGNYLRLVEFYPDDLDARVALAEMALAETAWTEAERHGRVAAELAPDDPRARAVVLALDYRTSRLDEDAAARSALAEEARAVLDRAPEALPARILLVDYLQGAGRPEAALQVLEPAMEQAADRRDLHDTRLRLLVSLGEDEAATEHMAAMRQRFDDDPVLREALLGWHLQRDRFDAAEAYLRAEAVEHPDDPWPITRLVELIGDTQGTARALDELQALLDAGGDPVLIRMARADLLHREGDAAAAIAELEDLVASVPPSSGRRDAQVGLAELLRQSGQIAAADAQVAAVLEADPDHVGALQLRAARMIAEDRPGDAVVALRRALAQEPRDAAVMLLLADAHLRDGARDLAAERLAMAVEVSDRGARESLRYATFLSEQGRGGAAVAVLEGAVRANPGDPRPVAALAELRLLMGDLDRAARDIAHLRRFDGANIARTADALQAALLERLGRTDETIGLLDGLAREGPGDMGALGLVLQSKLARGDLEGAESYVEELMAERPDAPALRFMRAALHVIGGERAEAEAIYRALMAELPEAEPPVLLLHSLLEADGRHDEAIALLDAALERQPASIQLRWLRASAFEAAGDFEGAIAIYEALYAQDTSVAVFANNLASLLSTARDDDASLERAFAIARRLRSSTVPSFRDTYGWIEYRRGNPAEALGHLEFAAERLPDSALVQYHFGMTLAALDRSDEARSVLESALAMDGLPARQARQARDRLEALAQTRASDPGQ